MSILITFYLVIALVIGASIFTGIYDHGFKDAHIRPRRPLPALAFGLVGGLFWGPAAILCAVIGIAGTAR